MFANHKIRPNLQFLQSKHSVIHVLLSLIVYIPFPKQGGCLEPQSTAGICQHVPYKIEAKTLQQRTGQCPESVLKNSKERQFCRGRLHEMFTYGTCSTIGLLILKIIETCLDFS